MKRPITALYAALFILASVIAIAIPFSSSAFGSNKSYKPAPLVSGTASPAVQYVGYNGSGNTITVTAATGGNGTYSYQWQLSTDNTNWYDMSGVTGLTLTPSWPHTYALYYRVATTSGGVTVYSNAAGVLIDSPPAVLSNSLNSSKNFVLTVIPRRHGFNPALMSTYTNADLMQSVAYMDGLGRPEQEVQVRASPNTGKDLVQPIAYDVFGREAKKYLPYASTSGDGSFKSNALTAGQGVFGFYNSTGTSGNQQGNGVVTIPNPFAQTAFEASPLNRPAEQGAPGTDWQIGAHTAKMQYASNGATEVRKWVVAANGNGASGTTYYGAGTLYMETAEDENGHPTVNYKDMEGHVVAKKVRLDLATNKWLLSTYIYDDFGNLAYVIPPIPTGTTYPTSFTELSTVFKNYIYAYHYDGRNRLIKKRVPGKGWNYMVYNQLDQVVATQDSTQINSKQWSYTKYDSQGRVVQSGTWNDRDASNTIVAIAQPALQTMVNGFTTLWETAGTSGYTNSAWPTTNATVLATSYYDDYGNIAGMPAAYAMPGDGTTRVTGLPVATQTAVLGSTANKLWTVNYYDTRGRAITTYKQHYLGGGTASALNYDTIRTGYNFNQQPTRIERSHFKKSGTVAALQIKLTDSMQYDHTGRITFTRNKVNSGSWVVLSRAYYNEIGQLKNKRLHSEDGGSSYLEDLQFMYNERGWLRASGSASSGLFNLELKYNNPGSGTLAQFNGNISQMNYHYAAIPSASVLATDRAFSYSYDDLNRLTNASLSTGTDLNEQLSYDELGNITALTRGGQTYGALGYTYTNGLLTAVSAASGTGFTARSYLYDRNGNATSGGTLETKLAYNMLNLPATVKNSANTTIITYTYDATGQKLRTVSTADGTREYISGINYVAGAITTIQTGEGRIFNSGGTYTYQYDLKDHLGNTRVTFDKHPSTGAVRILQEDEYYAFGLLKGRYDYGNGNRYLYNGKERQIDLLDQYDYGARFYDPVIARWTSVDPLTELGRRWSPFAYVFNNPMRFIDPDGMWGDYYDQGGNKVGTDGIDDKKVYVVADKKEAKAIEKNTKAGTNVQAGGVQSAVELPSAFVRGEMGKAVDRSNSPNKSVGDLSGGFHEEGGIFGTNSEGQEVVNNAEPGQYADPRTDSQATVDVFSGDNGTIKKTSGMFHVHPKGSFSPGSNTIGGVSASFNQEPSASMDIPTAKYNAGTGAVKGNSYVLGARDGKVYIYNGNGVVATFPLSKFTTIGIK